MKNLHTFRQTHISLLLLLFPNEKWLTPAALNFDDTYTYTFSCKLLLLLLILRARGRVNMYTIWLPTPSNNIHTSNKQFRVCGVYNIWALNTVKHRQNTSASTATRAVNKHTSQFCVLHTQLWQNVFFFCCPSFDRSKKRATTTAMNFGHLPKSTE